MRAKGRKKGGRGGEGEGELTGIQPLLDLIDDFSSVSESPGSIGDLERERRARWTRKVGGREGEGRKRKERKGFSVELKRSRWMERERERTSGIFLPSLRVMVVKGMLLKVAFGGLEVGVGVEDGGKERKGCERDRWLISDLSEGGGSKEKEGCCRCKIVEEGQKIFELVDRVWRWTLKKGGSKAGGNVT